MSTKKKVLLGIALACYLVAGNGVGRMSWDAYYGVKNGFGISTQNEVVFRRFVFYPSCTLPSGFTKKTVFPCDTTQFESEFPLVNKMPRWLYLWAMTFFWPVKLAVNIAGMFVAHVLMPFIGTAIAFFSMLFYFGKMFFTS